jgi:hypothetical protein
MREEPQRIAGRLEGTLRIPDTTPTAIVVIAHPLPTHGGTMRNPFIAQIARACAERGWLALRFNFRGTGESAGEFTGGEREVEDVDAAVRHARALAPAVPLGLVGYSFGARMSAAWLERGGRADAVVLVALPLLDADRRPLPPPRAPAGTFIVAAEDDQFGKADELRAALPEARVAVVSDAEHFFIGKRDEAVRLVCDELARSFAIPLPSP